MYMYMYVYVYMYIFTYIYIYKYIHSGVLLKRVSAQQTTSLTCLMYVWSSVTAQCGELEEYMFCSLTRGGQHAEAASKRFQWQARWALPGISQEKMVEISWNKLEVFLKWGYPQLSILDWDIPSFIDHLLVLPPSRRHPNTLTAPQPRCPQRLRGPHVSRRVQICRKWWSDICVAILYIYVSQMLHGAGIFTNIYLKHGPNVGKYSMEHLGMYTCVSIYIYIHIFIRMYDVCVYN